LEFIGSYHENAVGFWIRDIYYANVSAIGGLPNGNARFFSPRTIFSRMRQDLLNLSFRYVM
jgi:hypothetical protein